MIVRIRRRVQPTRAVQYDGTNAEEIRAFVPQWKLAPDTRLPEYLVIVDEANEGTWARPGDWFVDRDGEDPEVWGPHDFDENFEIII